METCKYHLCSTVLNGRQSVFCSIKCKNKYYVTQNRRNTKLKALDYKGGSCQRCGYNRCKEALDFHHLDPSVKEFGLSKNGNTRNWEKVKEEIDKCQLLCSNCHREKHAGLW